MSVIHCPDCGRLVAIRSPMHDCKTVLKSEIVGDKSIYLYRVNMPGKTKAGNNKSPLFLVAVVADGRRTYNQKWVTKRDAVEAFKLRIKKERGA